jgi:hypothetical protein
MSRIEMPHTYYGVAVSDIGEDGGLVALGHVEPRRAVAAFNRHARVGWGYPNLADDRSATLAEVLNDIDHTWAIQIDECGRCGRDPDCGVCLEIREAGWALEWGRAETDPGAIPVTIWGP